MRMSIASILLIVLCAGCENYGWTEYFHVNESGQRLAVTINGVEPNASPGNLLPGAGTSQLREVTAEIGEPVHIQDTITIRWTVHGESETSEVALNRDQLSIPRRIRGGRITFTFTAAGEWQVRYSRRRGK